jgi:lipopolysaccharide/colanic/teichoic acid biosynthesis glycosyltransferase
MKPTASTASLFSPARGTSAARVARPAPPSPLPPDRSAARLRVELFLKDVFDRSVAALLLVLSAPLVALSLLLVKLTSRGPALYSQRRVGQFGRVFTIYKIRTMYHNCEKLTGPRWSTPGDPRVTRVGGVLRALHLDELPQLINILRGQMSLIGPRPERPEIANKLRGLIEGYDARHAVVPGLSGNAQVRLPPDTSINSVRDKLVMDLAYVRHFSVWFDVKLLFMTGLKVLGLRPKRG